MNALVSLNPGGAFRAGFYFEVDENQHHGMVNLAPTNGVYEDPDSFWRVAWPDWEPPGYDLVIPSGLVRFNFTYSSFDADRRLLAQFVPVDNSSPTSPNIIFQQSQYNGYICDQLAFVKTPSVFQLFWSRPETDTEAFSAQIEFEIQVILPYSS